MEGSTERTEDLSPNPSSVSAQADGGLESGVRTVKKRSMWQDSRVRLMGFFAAVIVVLYLATVIFALLFGFLGNKTPRTSQEREIVAWESVVNQGNASADQWQSYVLSLLADEQYVRAEQAIKEANKRKLDQVQGQNMLFCTAELQRSKGDLKAAEKSFTEAMKKMEAAYDKELEEGGDLQNWALSFGLNENYFTSALRLGSIYKDQGKYKESLKMLDLFLGQHPQESGVLVDRGDVKVKLGDKKGAEADYRLALKFIPDYQPALDGLKKIGADSK